MLRVRFPLLVALVLGSGLALLLLGSMSLWRAWRDAADRLQLDARRATAATAAGLRAALVDPRVLDFASTHQRFEVREGQLVQPEALTRHLRHAMPSRVASNTEARLLQDVATSGGLDAALETLLHDELVVGADRHMLALRHAWRAHRADRLDVRDRWLRELAAAEPSPNYDIAASLILLAAAAGEPGLISDDHVTIAAAADAELARAAVRRLRDSANSELADRLERARADLAALQHTFDVVAGQLANLRTIDHPMTLHVGEELVLWHPDMSADRSGTGALVDARQLLERIRAADLLAPLPWTGELVTDAPTAHRDVDRFTETLVPGVLALAELPTDKSAASVSLALFGSLIAIGVCFAAGLFAMQRAIRAQDRANRAHADFLQSVTHELKTPLAAIRLLAERLESGRVDEARARDYYGLLADEAERLSVMIDNVLDLGRIERGERAFDRRPHDCDEIVQDTVELFRPLAQRDGMQLTIEGRSDARLTIDRGAIVQALLNVLENARKYARDGARIEVRVASVERAGAASEVAIDVRDFGPGVPVADRERVFERFERGTHQQDGSVAGLGIGLHIARCIVRAHGGELDCAAPEPAGQRGALFRFRLPSAGGVADDDRRRIEVAS